MTDETLGARIKRLREAKRWTQTDLADVLGVTAKAVSNWENDRNHPRGSMGALREAFGRQLEADEAAPVDPVEEAVRASALIEWRQDAVLSTYKRHIHEQQGEERVG